MIEEKKTCKTLNSKTEDDDRTAKVRPCGDSTFSVFWRKKIQRDFLCSYPLNNVLSTVTILLPWQKLSIIYEWTIGVGRDSITDHNF